MNDTLYHSPTYLSIRRKKVCGVELDVVSLIERLGHRVEQRRIAPDYLNESLFYSMSKKQQHEQGPFFWGITVRQLLLVLGMYVLSAFLYDIALSISQREWAKMSLPDYFTGRTAPHFFLIMG